ncbi:MAG: hypothetical protein FWE20_04875 [Defluviitaleaceae bacterium]|nr:hypothetical protein [Defluviitaleaceae bacterium]
MLELEGDDTMTNQQFDTVIKMVLNLLDSNEDDPELAREMILDLIIDEKSRQQFKAPRRRKTSSNSPNNGV